MAQHQSRSLPDETIHFIPRPSYRRLFVLMVYTGPSDMMSLPDFDTSTTASDVEAMLQWDDTAYFNSRGHCGSALLTCFIIDAEAYGRDSRWYLITRGVSGPI
jgi:hypothetical protein